MKQTTKKTRISKHVLEVPDEAEHDAGDPGESSGFVGRRRCHCTPATWTRGSDGELAVLLYHDGRRCHVTSHRYALRLLG